MRVCECPNPYCAWYGYDVEGFVPRLKPEVVLCPECGVETHEGTRGVPGPHEQPLYAAVGPGYSSASDCLAEAMAIVAHEKNGAIYQKLWDYEPYIAGLRLRQEVVCPCPRCTVQQQKGVLT